MAERRSFWNTRIGDMTREQLSAWAMIATFVAAVLVAMIVPATLTINSLHGTIDKWQALHADAEKKAEGQYAWNRDLIRMCNRKDQEHEKIRAECGLVEPRQDQRWTYHPGGNLCCGSGVGTSCLGPSQLRFFADNAMAAQGAEAERGAPTP